MSIENIWDFTIENTDSNYEIKVKPAEHFISAIAAKCERLSKILMEAEELAVFNGLTDTSLRKIIKISREILKERGYDQ